MTTETRNPAHSLPRQLDAEELIGPICDWYWEQDAEFRFTRLIGDYADGREALKETDCLGLTRWETGVEIYEQGGWSAHRELLNAHKPFRELLLYRRLADRTRRFMSVSGIPVFHDDRTFLGYRGIGIDVTPRQALDEELQRLRTILDGSLDMIYIVDRSSLRFLYSNRTAAQRSGYSQQELLKLGPEAVLRVDHEQLEHMYDEVIAAGDAGTITEMIGVTKEGLRTAVEVRRRALRQGDGWVIVSSSHDITSRVREARATERINLLLASLSATNEAIMHARSPDELYRQVCNAVLDAGKFIATSIILIDPETHSTELVAVAGEAGSRLLSILPSVDETVPEGRGLAGVAYRTGEPAMTRNYLRDPRTEHWHDVARELRVGSAAAVPLMHRKERLGVMLFYCTETHVFDDENVKLLVHMAKNVSFALNNLELEEERKRSEDRIHYLATHDALTGIANRAMFGELLRLAVDSGNRYDRRFAVMFIDLDRFKIINDTLGHDAGDILLKTVSARFQTCLRNSDVLARLGGDEFVVLAQEVETQEHISTVARKLLSEAKRTVDVSGQECRVTASIGIALFPRDGDNTETLIKSADAAMYLAKEEGKNNYQFYSDRITTQSLGKRTLETNLSRALAQNEFSLHYQAKLDLTTERINGVEALLRWDSNALGAVSPAQFIPVAEASGMIVPIGAWVLRTACAQNVAWQEAGLPPVCMAINLSLRQFIDPDLLDMIASTLEATGMAPGLLELETTEGVIMSDPVRAVQILTGIKEMGVRIAIDDFGTGYSSLSLLKRFPIDTLKIDRSFIRDMTNNAEDRAITQAIITRARSLSLTVVAEGVETEAQQSFLRAHACDEMQGFYFSKPVKAGEFAELLKHGTVDETALDKED